MTLNFPQILVHLLIPQIQCSLCIRIAKKKKHNVLNTVEEISEKSGKYRRQEYILS